MGGGGGRGIAFDCKWTKSVINVEHFLIEERDLNRNNIA